MHSWRGFHKKSPGPRFGLFALSLSLSPTEIFEPYTVFHSYTGIDGKPQKWRLPLRPSSNCSSSKEITQNCFSWMRLTTLGVCYFNNSQAQPILSNLWRAWVCVCLCCWGRATPPASRGKSWNCYSLLLIKFSKSHHNSSLTLGWGIHSTLRGTTGPHLGREEQLPLETQLSESRELQ